MIARGEPAWEVKIFRKYPVITSSSPEFQSHHTPESSFKRSILFFLCLIVAFLWKNFVFWSPSFSQNSLALYLQYHSLHWRRSTNRAFTVLNSRRLALSLLPRNSPKTFLQLSISSWNCCLIVLPQSPNLELQTFNLSRTEPKLGSDQTDWTISRHPGSRLQEFSNRKSLGVERGKNNLTCKKIGKWSEEL